MNKSLLLTIFLGAAAITGVLYSTQSNRSGIEIKHMNEFKAFISSFQRQYSVDEFVMRHQIFSESLDIIKRQNDLYDAGLSTYYLGVNQLADLTTQEIKRHYLGLDKNTEVETETENEIIDDQIQVPSSIDWTSKGLVNPIRNQQQCGSCWAFSAVAALEALYARKNGKLTQLSEQSLVDCSTSYGNYGCNGGYPSRAFQYTSAKGIASRPLYEYTGKDGRCKSYSSVFKNKSFKTVRKNSQSSLVSAISKTVVTVCIAADSKSFQLYKGGIFNDSRCGTSMDHAVAAVGYGKGFYKIRNSWGQSWGSKGYILLGRNGNGAGQCGVQQLPVYPTA